MYPLFEPAELDRRLGAFLKKMDEAEIDIAVVTAPENIFYLTGLEHWGYFAPHALVVSGKGEMTLVTRFVERATVANQVVNARFHGHEEGETIGEGVARVLAERGVSACAPEGMAALLAEGETLGGRPRIGVEKNTPGMTWQVRDVLVDHAPRADWRDITDVVDALRLVKSPAEQRWIRQAAQASSAGMAAAVAALAPDVQDVDAAAACLAAMTRAGSSFPGFGPFIRPAAYLDEEHTTWRGCRIARNDRVLLELSGCVHRYHAPLGRFVYVGGISPGDREASAICREAYAAALAALRPGALAGEVYAAWQDVLARAGLSDYRRHHCGYSVGIGFPPSWTGGNKVVGLRENSDMELAMGMSFHLLSWLIGSGCGDAFLSDTVLLTAEGAEVLTSAPQEIEIDGEPEHRRIAALPTQGSEDTAHDQ